MKQRGFAPIVILVLITLGIFFAPIPSIIKEDALCQPCPLNTEPSLCPGCPKKGDIEWRPSIFKRVVSRLSKPGGLMEIINPPPSPSSVVPENPSGSPDPTANWKTYTHQTLGYSFSYPENLQINAFDNRVVIQIDPPDPRQIVGICPRSISFSASDIKSKPITTKNEYLCVYNSIILGNKILVESLYRENNKGLIDQILSTFKFLDSSEGESVEFLN